MAKPDLNKRLDEDRNAMYDGMCHIGEYNEIWQNRLIGAVCKAIWDILEWIERKENKHDR